LLMGMLKTEGAMVDLPWLCYTEIARYLHLEMRYQVPYSTQVHGGQFVQRAKDHRECLYLFRDLLVFKRDTEKGL